MRLSIFIGLLTLFIGMSLISGICEMQYLSGVGDQVSVFYKLMHPSFTYDTFANLGSVFFFDYAFFNGSLSIIRYLIFLPIGLATLLSIGLALIRGISSS
jgi:hypothetical protein